MKPCLTCGAPSSDTRCPEHTRDRTFDKPKASSAQRGYDQAWRRLSERARRIQPWCSECFTTEDLTTDHSQRAWQRKAAGKTIRLRDVLVLCRSCNARKGRARPDDQGGRAADERPRPADKAQSPSHTPRGIR